MVVCLSLSFFLQAMRQFSGSWNQRCDEAMIGLAVHILVEHIWFSCGLAAMEFPLLMT